MTESRLKPDEADTSDRVSALEDEVDALRKELSDLREQMVAMQLRLDNKSE